ncbi:MAG TPA: hypothetical protein PKU97_17825 [Kofleriaceae bacterium]|nr:hypothetical protein [Kofleriaceae bacterium]
MTMTLGGRLQTRLVLLSSIGLLWTFAITALLPRPDTVSVRVAFQITLVSAIVTNILGFATELFYHALQQLRWEKDWPPLLGLLMGGVEIWPVWMMVQLVASPPAGAFTVFAAHFASTWFVVWLVALGPVGVIQPRWRFEGGGFGRRPGEALVPFVVLNGSMAITVTVLWALWP